MPTAEEITTMMPRVTKSLQDVNEQSQFGPESVAGTKLTSPSLPTMGEVHPERQAVITAATPPSPLWRHPKKAKLLHSLRQLPNLRGTKMKASATGQAGDFYSKMDEFIKLIAQALLEPILNAPPKLASRFKQPLSPDDIKAIKDLVAGDARWGELHVKKEQQWGLILFKASGGNLSCVASSKIITVATQPFV
ncbi:hypothetical protein ABZP36_034452 [Zizania latifolia]